MLNLALAALLVSAPANSVTVQFSGLVPHQGHLMVQLCTADEFVRFACARQQRIAAGDAPATVVFTGVPAGRYGIMSFQDLDDNGQIARAMTGMPTEPWGYSGHPEFLMGPPSFDSVAFDVPATGASLNIHLQK